MPSDVRVVTDRTIYLGSVSSAPRLGPKPFVKWAVHAVPAHHHRGTNLFPGLLLSPLMRRSFDKDAVRKALNGFPKTGQTPSINDLLRKHDGERLRTAWRVPTLGDPAEPWRRTTAILAHLAESPADVRNVRATYPWVTLYGPGLRAAAKRPFPDPWPFALNTARTEARTRVLTPPKRGRIAAIPEPTYDVALHACITETWPNETSVDEFVASAGRETRRRKEGLELCATNPTSDAVRKAAHRWDELVAERFLGAVLVCDPTSFVLARQLPPRAGVRERAVIDHAAHTEVWLVNWLRSRHAAQLLLIASGRCAGTWDFVIAGTEERCGIKEFLKRRREPYVRGKMPHGDGPPREFQEFGDWSPDGPQRYRRGEAVVDVDLFIGGSAKHDVTDATAPTLPCEPWHTPGT